VGDRSTARHVAIAALAFALLGWPLLAVFDRADRVGGVPLLWLYLLVAWAVVVALIAAVSRER
jgi:Kef-type K+ transport system membrane component KefB